MRRSHTQRQSLERAGTITTSNAPLTSPTPNHHMHWGGGPPFPISRHRRADHSPSHQPQSRPPIKLTTPTFHSHAAAAAPVISKYVPYLYIFRLTQCTADTRFSPPHRTAPCRVRAHTHTHTHRHAHAHQTNTTPAEPSTRCSQYLSGSRPPRRGSTARRRRPGAARSRRWSCSRGVWGLRGRTRRSRGVRRRERRLSGKRREAMTREEKSGGMEE
jgi:hypothetical protein